MQTNPIKLSFFKARQIDVTKLTASYDDGLIAIWEYPSCKIVCRNLIPVRHPRLEWNKFTLIYLQHTRYFMFILYTTSVIHMKLQPALNDTINIQ